MSTITCTKRFANYPFAHRQHVHEGHCSLIHGHNWDFEVTFAADSLDSKGFVIDFGRLSPIKELFTELFDHTLVLNSDDPKLDYIEKSLTLNSKIGSPLAKIVVVPNCGAEGLARFVFDEVNICLQSNPELEILTGSRTRNVRAIKVTVFEDEKNSATFCA